MASMTGLTSELSDTALNYKEGYWFVGLSRPTVFNI